MTEDPRPTPPECPEDYMCCGRGCMPCIFDIYNQALARYEEQLREWENRQVTRSRSQAP